MREYIENIASDDNAQYYIILDEIQLVENFVRAINFEQTQKLEEKRKLNRRFVINIIGRKIKN